MSVENAAVKKGGFQQSFTRLLFTEPCQSQSCFHDIRPYSHVFIAFVWSWITDVQPCLNSSGVCARCRVLRVEAQHSAALRVLSLRSDGENSCHSTAQSHSVFCALPCQALANVKHAPGVRHPTGPEAGHGGRGRISIFPSVTCSLFVSC